ncbi:MAG: InlB B-repeat-containing protein [Clostridia bacterium]|nr:InlB B-repeat-containing protein [Clostridia bacterium]
MKKTIWLFFALLLVFQTVFSTACNKGLTVTFDSQGGSTVKSVIGIDSGSKITLPSAPSKDGFSFEGWYKEKSCQTKWNFDIDTVTTSITLYASWIENTLQGFTVTYDSQGGSAVNSITNIVSGSKITPPSAPSKDGFSFEGWYLDAECTEPWHFDTNTVTANITLYASWIDSTPKTVAVPYSVNITNENIPEGSELVILVFNELNLLGRRTIAVQGAGNISGEMVVSALLTDALRVEVYLYDGDGELLSTPLQWQYRAVGTVSENPTPAQIVSAYISAFGELYEKGLQYAESGMTVQSEYAISWAAAAVSSMRFCIERFLDSKYLEESKEAGLPFDFEEIAAYNYACPYPSFFYGWFYEFRYSENNNEVFYEQAQFWYSYAVINPDFVPALDNELKKMADMTVAEKLSARAQLLELETAIFEHYTPPPYEEVRSQDTQRFDSAYWRETGMDYLEENIYGYRDFENAFKQFKIALLINPFDGDNFAMCALTCYYLEEYEQMAIYINHGLCAAPNHEGLNALYELMKEREEEEW